MKLKTISLLFAVAALASACNDDDAGGGTAPETSGQVRIVHLSPDGPNVDVLVDDVVVASDVPYLSASDYLDVEAGSRNILIRDAGTDAPLLDQEVTVEDGGDLTLLVGGAAADVALTPLDDDLTPPAAGNTKVRVIHGAPSAGVVDVFVTEPDADLSLETPVATGVNFGDVSPYIELPAGDYQLRVVPSGTLDVAVDSGPVTLGDGEIRTGIAVDAQGGGEPLGAVLLEDLN